MTHADPRLMEGAEGTIQPIQEHRDPLPKTKLFFPPVHSKRVTRSGLIVRMNNNLDKTLILVSAPAGFGKTTLLAEWVAQAGLPLAWLSLDAGDNDPHRFLRYAIAALNVALANAEAAGCATTGSMLQSEPFALVLDDYQFITGPEVNSCRAVEVFPLNAYLPNLEHPSCHQFQALDVYFIVNACSDESNRLHA